MKAAILLLAGCGAQPISNAVFYEDAAFLKALPTSQIVAAPAAILAAPDGTSDPLAEARAAGGDLQARVLPLTASADELAKEPADARSDVALSWDAVTVAAELPDGVTLWYVKAQIVKPAGGDTTWTMSASASRAGPFVPVGQGTLTTAGAGSCTWDEAAFAGVVGGDLDGSLAVTAAKDAQGTLQVGVDEHGPGAGAPTVRSWAVIGGVGLGFSGTFDVASSGAWPGYAVVVNAADGGRALGWVFENAEKLEFQACWDAKGDTTWSAGDGDVTATGSPDACALPAFPTGG